MTPDELRNRRRQRTQKKIYLACVEQHERQVREAVEAQERYQAQQAECQHAVDLMMAHMGDVNANLRVLLRAV